MAGVSGERSSSWSDSARSDSDDNDEDIDSAIADARTALVRCEQEMALIKSALRNLGQPSTSEEENTLVIKWIKIDGLPETAVPKLSVQLSSPIVSAELTKIYSDAIEQPPVSTSTTTSTSPVDTANDGKLDDKSWTMAESIEEDSIKVSVGDQDVIAQPTDATKTEGAATSDDEFHDAEEVTILEENKTANETADTVTTDSIPTSTSTGKDTEEIQSDIVETESETAGADAIESNTTTTTATTITTDTEQKTSDSDQTLASVTVPDLSELDVTTTAPTASTAEGSTVVEGAFVTFRGVETGQATLSIEATDSDIPLGSSVSYDLAPYTSELVSKENELKVYTSELPVAIFPPSNNNDNGDDDDDYDGLELALCTVTLKLEYTPSVKDKREELYEQLNKASEKKGLAIEKLRQLAMAQANAAAAARARSGATTTSVIEKPAVKPGFLNKKPASSTKETTTASSISLVSKVTSLYGRYFGPSSMLRLYAPVAKNYVIFFGFLAMSHFKGYIFSLPSPV